MNAIILVVPRVDSPGWIGLTCCLVPVERIYGRRGVPIRYYPLRGQYQHTLKRRHNSHSPLLIDINDPAPPPVTSVLDEDVELIALQRERRRMDGKLDGTNGFLNLLTDV
jgi:hypothetical protein